LGSERHRDIGCCHLTQSVCVWWVVYKTSLIWVGRW
jgi:hypothetical protein